MSTVSLIREQPIPAGLTSFTTIGKEKAGASIATVALAGILAGPAGLLMGVQASNAVSSVLSHCYTAKISPIVSSNKIIAEKNMHVIEKTKDIARQKKLVEQKSYARCFKATAMCMVAIFSTIAASSISDKYCSKSDISSSCRFSNNVFYTAAATSLITVMIFIKVFSAKK